MSNEDLFYLKDVKSGKYHSISGLVTSSEEATKFTEVQLKRRLNVPRTYTNVFKEKMKNSGLVMEPINFVSPKKFLTIISNGVEFNEFDILTCSGKFFFSKGLVTKDIVVYSEYRDSIRIPDVNKGKLLSIELTVKKKDGRVIRT